MDWLWFSVPLGSLMRVWPEVGTFPFVDRDERGDAHAEWQERIEAWLVRIAEHVHSLCPIRFGVVGHELEGDDGKWWLWDDPGVPPESSRGFLLPGEDGTLNWHAPIVRGGWVLGDPDRSWGDIFGWET